MFPRLTMLNTMTSHPDVVFENSKMATIPFSGKSISISEINPQATLSYPVKANQHGISYLVMATNKVSVKLVQVNTSNSGVERKVLSLSTATFSAFSMLEPKEDPDLSVSFELLIENVSNERVKVSTIVT